MSPQVVLVTGASRGVGAEVATLLATPDRHVIVNYREKAKRADDVVAAIRTAGGHATAIQADLTDDAAVTAMLDIVDRAFGRLDILVLNASGGLERGADSDYPMRINRDAQVRLTQLALPLMPPGGRIVYVTSHLAHFYGRKPVPTDYLPIAVSKQAGEAALRKMMKITAADNVSFIVASADMIEASTMVRLFERRDPDAIAARRAAGTLPTATEFAEAIAHTAQESDRHGETIYVGGLDYLG